MEKFKKTFCENSDKNYGGWAENILPYILNK